MVAQERVPENRFTDFQPENCYWSYSFNWSTRPFVAWGYVCTIEAGRSKVATHREGVGLDLWRRGHRLGHLRLKISSRWVATKRFPLRMSYHCFVCPKNLSFSAISLIAFLCVCMFWSHSIEFCQDEDQRDLVHGLVWEKWCPQCRCTWKD